MQHFKLRTIIDNLTSIFGYNLERNLAAGFISLLIASIGIFYYVKYLDSSIYITSNMILPRTVWGFFDLNDSIIFYWNMSNNGNLDASYEFSLERKEKSMAIQMLKGTKVAVDKQTTPDSAGNVYVCVRPLEQDSCYWMVDWIVFADHRKKL